ncbi:MAG TPA: phosphatidylglycerol lysyltransferase domain-containing protein, partial [Candidatus Saccharimonadales bacterium]|nr:phosphatidylglycerol lysyltransferase domain-containing protein [Candidatus Saccharimonadales bacterium]
AVGLAVISLFQPLRARYSHQKEWHEQARQLIYSSSQDSEDFFKLWPHDKTYFFSVTEHSGVAYKVQRGVALVVGDPFGEPKEFKKLLREFEDFCFGNDWRPAFIHTTVRSKKLFAARGYHQQLIGEEAMVDIAHFVTEVSQQKYFREIQKRFTKLGYTFEVLQPPYHAAIVDRVKTISDEWLQRPGREERRFMMGFFSEEYIQQGPLAIARDAAGTIQAYMNLLPSPLPEEADYDMLRSAKHAAGNINDYVLMGVMTHLYNEGTAKHVNMGLCPLAGLEDEPSTLINRTLRFVYSNGDRFYSFRGLYKFKAKYEPVWHDRYIVYRGNPADFTRVMTALNKAMKY